MQAVKWSTADIQCSQKVKSLFAMRESGQAAKMTVKISWECHPLTIHLSQQIFSVHRSHFSTSASALSSSSLVPRPKSQVARLT